jgi:hypothetical protein
VIIYELIYSRASHVRRVPNKIVVSDEGLKKNIQCLFLLSVGTGVVYEF